MTIRFGYKASAEQFGPRDLLDFSVHAEEVGLDILAVSDHFQPWRHSTGRAPNALVWLGALAARTERAHIGTSVLTPTLRYHPAIVAQAFGTLAQLAPGRVFLGVGTGEAMNETPATGIEWPAFKERFDRLVEAIELKRLLWAEERVSFEGKYYRTERATIYERPEHPIPIYVAASGARTARMAGSVADGFICTSGKKPELYDELLAAVEEGAAGAGKEPGDVRRMIEIKVSYDTTATARATTAAGGPRSRSRRRRRAASMTRSSSSASRTRAQSGRRAASSSRTTPTSASRRSRPT